MTLKKHSKLIIYLDVNNLYSWAMSIYLLFGGFKWLKNVDGFYLNSMSKKSPIEYILEVDLEHPDELHVLRNDYPLASEKFAISYDMMSYYCEHEIAGEYERKVDDVTKLIPNLRNKTNYVLHYK